MNDVQVAIQIINYFHIKFAIRSGGHSPNPGWSSIGNEGVLLDMERLRSISLSRDSSFASIGPGARWMQVYEVLGSDNAVVVGARVPDVGVGGLLLGGQLYLNHPPVSFVAHFLQEDIRFFRSSLALLPIM